MPLLLTIPAHVPAPLQLRPEEAALVAARLRGESIADIAAAMGLSLDDVLAILVRGHVCEAINQGRAERQESMCDTIDATLQTAVRTLQTVLAASVDVQEITTGTKALLAIRTTLAREERAGIRLQMEVAARRERALARHLGAAEAESGAEHLIWDAGAQALISAPSRESLALLDRGPFANPAATAPRLPGAASTQTPEAFFAEMQKDGAE